MPARQNICPKCGGKLVVEAIGNYGDVYYMKSDGSMSKRKIRRYVYETSGEYLIYCENCRNLFDPQDYGY